MSFPLIGNERIKDACLALIAENRLPHAILIEGDPGTGRHTLAHYLAAASVCSGENPPCGACHGCHLAEIGTHPDISVTAPEDGKKNIAVAQIRAVRAAAYVKPHMANHRVFLIDGADSMNEQAQNALLKVLEEPPGGVLFLLIAESAAALLDTILSRCILLSLVPPDREQAAEYLATNTDYSAADIENALDETGNNIGAALRIFGGGETKAQSAAEQFITLLPNGDGAALLKITAPFEKSRVDANLFFKELRLATAAAVKKNRQNAYTAGILMRFYDRLPALEESLQTNINLGLLFCALVCAAEEITKN